MRARDMTEVHRTATPLELFFDLCFVVAVAQAAAGLHHALSADHLEQALTGYPLVFFGVWWAWMNFTWFASAYDVDDVLYRLMTLVQITGVLVLAAGVPRAFDDGDLTVITIGYLVMRVALAGQWLRAAGGDPARRRTDLRYAGGVAACMAGWLLLLLVPGDVHDGLLLVMIALELSVPMWAERAERTTWHPTHIAERYGLFTLIVLGESVASATVALQTALDAGGATRDVLTIAAGGLLVVFSMWWIYFALPNEEIVGAGRAAFGRIPHRSFAWGYGHYVVFGAAAGVGAGIAVTVDQAVGDAAISAVAAGYAAAVPISLFVLSVWWLVVRPARRAAADAAFPVAAALVLLTPLTPEPVLLAGVVLGGLVAVTTIGSPDPEPPSA